MSSGSRECIASTIFVPVAVAPVLSAYTRNCSFPTRVGPGIYQVILNQDVDKLKTSITTRAAGTIPAAGAARDVTVVLTRNLPTPNKTTIDIYLRDNAGVASDDADQVEVTLAQLPL
jgi:hypothetical protein